MFNSYGHIGLYVSSKFQLVISRLAMSLRLGFCTSKNVVIGGGGWVHPKGANSMAAYGLAVENLVGTGFAISLLLCTTELVKRSSGQVVPPVLAVKLLSQSVEATIGQELLL